MKKQIVIKIEKIEANQYYGTIHGLCGRNKTKEIPSLVAPHSIDELLKFFTTKIPKIEEWMNQIQ